MLMVGGPQRVQLPHRVHYHNTAMKMSRQSNALNADVTTQQMLPATSV